MTGHGFSLSLNVGKSSRAETKAAFECFGQKFEITVEPHFAYSSIFLLCSTEGCSNSLYWSKCSKCGRETASSQYAWKKTKDERSWTGWREWLTTPIGVALGLNYLDASLLSYEVEDTLRSVCSDLVPGYASHGAGWHASKVWATYGERLAAAR